MSMPLYFCSLQANKQHVGHASITLCHYFLITSNNSYNIIAMHAHNLRVTLMSLRHNNCTSVALPPVSSQFFNLGAIYKEEMGEPRR